MATSRVLPLVDGDVAEIGPYRVLGRLGAGGMGIVYAGADRAGRRVAVKVVRAEIADDPSFRARFRREVDLLRRVTGPCLVPLLGADTDTARPWLATEYIAGPTLHDHLARQGTLGTGALLSLAAGVAGALARVHAAGVVHRDLKPGNIILAEGGPRVLDFGIAHVLDETSITRTGGWTGTPGWTSPEEYRGRRAGTAADVFAWGALVAYAATGRLPFGSGAPDAVAYRIMREEADTAGVPVGLLPLVRAALAKDPELRPEAAELVDACLRLLAAQPPTPGAAAHAYTTTQVGGSALEAAIAGHWMPPTVADSPWQHVRWQDAPRERRPAVRRPGRPRLLAAAATLVLLAGGGFGYTMVNRPGEAGGQAVTGPSGQGASSPGGPPTADASREGAGAGGSAVDGQGVDPAIAVSGVFGTKASLTLPDRLPHDEPFGLAVVGEGDGPAVRQQDWVTVNYTAADWTAGRALASSYDPGERPQVFQAGADQVIDALERSVVGRPVGTRLLVVAPPEDAFGAKGSEALGVGPDATLVFVLDIMSAVAPGSPGAPDSGSSTVGSPRGGRPSARLPEAAPIHGGSERADRPAAA
ncbi:protein kinase domain-containing protein [Peterkaempfera bronchialis]|uniref:peptidylprolyl isomerase n=1 Tax=Peterkaempfera bronchialis TaxID=2126346 RepID=A0A345SV83_9ACTN|nr:protein kinase [Peterkaempfera bronchialis]AXI77638.1 serine/threonine protein kinase [Peterkaempfera bronchialis]